MSKFRINFNPNILDFNILISQLDKHGFSDNITQPHDRKRICESFENNRFVVMYADGEPIGFTTWRGEMQWAIVEYKWLHPNFRKQGLGRLFAQLVYQEFLKKNIFYVLVEPATPDGYGMSDSIGFRPLCDTDYGYSTKLFYKFLRPNRPQIQQSDAGYEMFIWHDWNNQKEAAQIYRIDDMMESNPIISIVNSDAYVEFREDGKILKKGICKRFFTDYEFQYYGLLYFNTNLSDWLKKFK